MTYENIRSLLYPSQEHRAGLPLHLSHNIAYYILVKIKKKVTKNVYTDGAKSSYENGRNTLRPF